MGGYVEENAAAIKELTLKVDAFEPDRAAAELDAVFKYGGSTLLAGMVANGNIEPAIEFLGSVETAIADKVPGQQDKASLGGKAIKMVVGALKHSNLEYDLDAAKSLVEQAYGFAALIEDPRDRALTLRQLSDDTAEAAILRQEREETISLGWYADSGITKAAEAALEIEDPSEKSFAIIETAEQSAWNMQRLANELKDSDDKSALLNTLRDHTQVLYEQAMGHSTTIKDPVPSYDHRARTAVSMAKSAVRLYNADGLLAERLAETSADILDATIVAYEDDGTLASHKELRKVKNLVDVGAALAKVIDDECRTLPDGSNIGIRQPLIDQTLGIFKAAASHVEKSQRPRLSSMGPQGGDRHGYLDGVTHTATTAAGRLLRMDFAAGKELLEIGFKLAQARNDKKKIESDTDKVLREINALAATRWQSVQESFELYALAYNLEKSIMPENSDKSSHGLEANATDMLKYLAEVDPQKVSLDEIDRPFLEFAISQVSESDNGYWNAKHLRALASYVADPELKQALEERAEAQHAKETARQEPKTEAAQLAKFIASGRR